MSSVYPSDPAEVPEGLTSETPGHRRNARLALLGLLAFVASYLALTAWFSYEAVTLLHEAFVSGTKSWGPWIAGLLATFIAVFLGKALLFFRRHRDPTLVEIRPEDEPRLFEFVHRLAEQTHAPRPHRVFLSPRVNAAVFYDLSLLNLLWPSRKNLELGLALVNVLTLTEFKAVLAHELGHFAQRTMAVSRWVYVGQQIAGNIVAKRDLFDDLLLRLTNADIRVGWIGWILRTIVWSIRSVLDSFFGLVLIAERALSREMELQADLVAVTVTGSDALINALHKLHAADAAWDIALDIAAREVGEGREPRDILAMHTKVIEHTRWLLDDPSYGATPASSQADDGTHRVFRAALAVPPQMWSTHPPNHVREENAKRHRVRCEHDDREAWLVFADADATRARVTAVLVEQLPRVEEATIVDPSVSIAAVDRRYAKLYLHPRYRGVYLARAITRYSRDPRHMRGDAPQSREAIDPVLTRSYSVELAELCARLDDLAAEKVQLEALLLGVATAPGGVIRHRGRSIARRDLPATIAQVESERTAAERAFVDELRSLHGAAWSAAHVLGRGWPEYIDGLLAVLHYAEHSEANVDDAHGHFANTLAVVTADGHVSKREARRVIASGGDLQLTLEQCQSQAKHVVLPHAVAIKLGVESWAEVLPDALELPPPDETNLGDFVRHVGGWHGAYSIALWRLRETTLEVLLEAELHVERCLADGSDPGDAVTTSRVPLHYMCLLRGDERELQRRLDWWDRFMVADGWGPGTARLVVAGAVVATVAGFSGVAVTPTVTVYNGLRREVDVDVAGARMTVGAGMHAELDFTGGGPITVEARTDDGIVIESFTADASSSMARYVYNVASASPMIEWTAAFGPADAREPELLGAPRWFTTQADYLFRDPPKSIRSSDGGVRGVLGGFAGASPVEMLGQLSDPDEQVRVALVHARWDPLWRGGDAWMMTAAGMPGYAEVLAERLEEKPDDVLLQRLEMDTAGEKKAEVCARFVRRAEERPDDVDRAYLAARCMPDGSEKSERFLELQAMAGNHPWIALGAAQAYADLDDPAAAAAAFATAGAQLPMLDDRIAVLEARMRRLASPDGFLIGKKLAERSARLAFLDALETGTRADWDAHGMSSEYDGGYGALDKGDPAAAVARAGPELARIVRLAAASDGADPSLLAKVRALGSGDGIDDGTVWTAIAFAKRHDLPDAPYLEHIAALSEEERTAMMWFTDRERMLAEGLDGEKAFGALPIELRGQAAVMGIITLGEDAPAQWRIMAMRLLFAPERPYFAPAKSRRDVPRAP